MVDSDLLATVTVQLDIPPHEPAMLKSNIPQPEPAMLNGSEASSRSSSLDVSEEPLGLVRPPTSRGPRPSASARKKALCVDAFSIDDAELGDDDSELVVDPRLQALEVAASPRPMACPATLPAGPATLLRSGPEVLRGLSGDSSPRAAYSVPSSPMGDVDPVPDDQRVEAVVEVCAGLPSPTASARTDASPSCMRCSFDSFKDEKMSEEPTEFATQLAEASRNAPARLADKMVRGLQESCLNEASLLGTCLEWQVSMPDCSRSKLPEVAREFVCRVEALGFENVEWWTGHRWRPSAGRFSVLKDTLYERHYMRVRVRWLAGAEGVVSQRSSFSDAASSVGKKDMLTVLQEIQTTLELQGHMLSCGLAAQSGHRPAARRTSQHDVSQPSDEFEV